MTEHWSFVGRTTPNRVFFSFFFQKNIFLDLKETPIFFCLWQVPIFLFQYFFFVSIKNDKYVGKRCRTWGNPSPERYKNLPFSLHFHLNSYKNLINTKQYELKKQKSCIGYGISLTQHPLLLSPLSLQAAALPSFFQLYIPPF